MSSEFIAFTLNKLATVMISTHMNKIHVISPQGLEHIAVVSVEGGAASLYGHFGVSPQIFFLLSVF